MSLYLLLKNDGERDDARYGLTADDTTDNGVIGADSYTASHTTDALFPGQGGIETEIINGKQVTVQNDKYGKWVCVLNYEHYSGEDPSVSPGSQFPTLPNGLSKVEDVESLGTSGETRHVDNISQYGSWGVDAIRLEAETENHGRRIHYYTTNQNVIDAVTGTSSISSGDLNQNVIFYDDHTAALPRAGTNLTSSNSNRIFGYEFPMYEVGEHHWALSGGDNRWEVDDKSGDDSKTTVHRVWARIDSNPDGGGGNVSTFDVTNISSVVSSAATQDSVLSADDQFASVNTSTVVSALSESFNTVQRTSLGNAMAAVTGQTTVSTTSTEQALVDALVEPIVAAQTAKFTSETAATFGTKYAQALRASGSFLPTGASGDTAVTSLGTAEVSTVSTNTASTDVSVFAIASPASTNTVDSISGVDTSTDAIAITENAILTSLTPTLDIVVAVKKGAIGLESAFADSLSASVGAQTSIKVAKTVANASEQAATSDTSTGVNALIASVSALERDGDAVSNSVVDALTAASALQTFASSSTASNADSDVAAVDGTKVNGAVDTSATSDAAVRDAVVSELSASGQTSVTAQSLSAAAQALTEQGIAETQTEAAGIVAQVVSNYQGADLETSTAVDAFIEQFDTVERVALPDTFALSDAAQEIFNTNAISTGAVAKALPDIGKTEMDTATDNGGVTAKAFVDAVVSDTNMSPLEAVVCFLFLSRTGKNHVSIMSGQHYEITNPENRVEVLT